MTDCSRDRCSTTGTSSAASRSPESTDTRVNAHFTTAVRAKSAPRQIANFVTGLFRSNLDGGRTEMLPVPVGAQDPRWTDKS